MKTNCKKRKETNVEKLIRLQKDWKKDVRLFGKRGCNQELTPAMKAYIFFLEERAFMSVSRGH